MIFDRAARFAERYDYALTGFRSVVENARLFHFPVRPQDVLPKSYDAETMAFHSEFFALPFPVIAVEDEVSCVFWWDAQDDAVGLAKPRFFLEFAPIEKDRTEAWTVPVPPALLSAMEGKTQIVFGRLDALGSGKGSGHYSVDGTIFAFLLADDDDILNMTQESLGRSDVDAQVLRNAVTSLEEIMQLNQPDRFILETAPVAERARKRKILRSDDRPIYTLLTPSEIRKRMGGEEQGATRGAHERRRHVRRYPDDPARWPNVHGRQIVVPATWVGPEESIVKKRRYRVRLDL